MPGGFLINQTSILLMNNFSFGFFSAFAFSSRLGKFGNFVEDFIIYPLDYMMWILGIRAYPTVIVSIILAR